jgi:hypothetical protein
VGVITDRDTGEADFGCLLERAYEKTCVMPFLRQGGLWNPPRLRLLRRIEGGVTSTKMFLRRTSRSESLSDLLLARQS